MRTLTAYEVSVSKLSAYDNVDTFDMDAEFFDRDRISENLADVIDG